MVYDSKSSESYKSVYFFFKHCVFTQDFPKNKSVKNFIRGFFCFVLFFCTFETFRANTKKNQKTNWPSWQHRQHCHLHQTLYPQPPIKMDDFSGCWIEKSPAPSGGWLQKGRQKDREGEKCFLLCALMSHSYGNLCQFTAVVTVNL